MKKILMALAGFMALAALAACDRIESDEYSVYDGAVVAWTPTAADIPAVQRAYVEKYTGPKCNNCPRADETLDAAHQQFGDQLVVVSINHPTGQGTPFSGDPDMRTDGGTVWDRYFGITGIPAAYLDRNTATQYGGPMANITGDIATALQRQPVVAMQVSASGSSQVAVTVDFKLLQDYSSPLTLTVAVTEDALVYKQFLPDGSLDSNYVHNHMLRKVVTGFWGRDINIGGTAGEAFSGSLTFAPANDLNLANCHIVAFISDKSSRQVLNCASCKIQ